MHNVLDPDSKTLLCHNRCKDVLYTLRFIAQDLERCLLRISMTNETNDKLAKPVLVMVDSGLKTVVGARKFVPSAHRTKNSHPERTSWVQPPGVLDGLSDSSPSCRAQRNKLCLVCKRWFKLLSVNFFYVLPPKIHRHGRRMGLCHQTTRRRSSNFMAPQVPTQANAATCHCRTRLRPVAATCTYSGAKRPPERIHATSDFLQCWDE